MANSFWIKTTAALLAALFCASGALALTVSAETGAEDYEAKKAAYRQKIMADDVTSDDFLIGSWVSFYSFGRDSYETQLDQMAAAGINFNIFPRDFGEGQMFNAAYWNNVEEQYAKRNMVYFMNGNMDESLVRIGVNYARGKEHCIGYHVKDEPTGDILEDVGRQMKAYRQADPTRYPFTNLLPSYASTEQLGGTYRQHVENYVAAVGAENMEYLSHDYYPFLEGDVVLKGIFGDMEVMRSVAYENGKMKTHAFPQSTSWEGVRMPNIDEMRWHVYGYLAYGFKALTWFNMVCPIGFSNSVILGDGTIPDRELYDAWSELNWEVRGMSSILMNLDAAHAYHVRKNVRGVEYLPEDFFLQPVSGEKNDFVISYMEAKDGGTPYLMIFNKSYEDEATCALSLDASSGVEGLDYFDPFTGEHTAADLSDGILRDTFKAGEGKLYRIDASVDGAETDGDGDTVADAVTDTATEAVTDMATDATVETDTETSSQATDTATAQGAEGCSSTAATMPVLLASLLPAVALTARKRRRRD